MPSPWIVSCESEPIHMPGAIQGWGALLVARETDLIVRHASANLSEFIDIPAGDAIGRPLGAVLDRAIVASLVAGSTPQSPPGALTAIVRTAAGHRAFALSSYRLNDSIYIEMEPPPGAGAFDTWSEARGVVAALRGAPDLTSLFAVAATEMRHATGFDRSMVYRFDAIGHGEVVAEDCAADLESFLGTHYPASDVPRQARRLYLRQRVRVIEDVQAPAVALLHAADAPKSPDLSMSALRAVSPIHLEYLRNMGVRASVAVSLTVDGALWGMLVCHHRGPRCAASGTRALADLIGQVVSMMIGTLRETEVRADVARYRARVASLAGKLAEQQDGIAGLLAALAKDGPALMAVCDASGAIVRLGGRMVSLGNAPEGVAATDFLDTLVATAPHGGEAFATAETGPLLAVEQAEALRDRAAGALLLPLIHTSGDCIVWVRPEQARTVRWGGDPSAQLDGEAIAGALSPRRSFAVWKQEVRGQSVAWTPAQIEAAYGLRRAIDHALMRCAEFELARLRQHDALTGLPNRRLLRDWLDAWAHERSDCFLLIVDIDRFKSLNEAVGERLGDRVLIEAASRIVRVAAGPGEMIARIGSSAFGVFGHAMDPGAARALAEALRAAMAEPFEVAGKPIRVTASVGIAPAVADAPGGDAVADAPGNNADEMMARADIALQSARARGGNRSQMFASELRSGAGRRMEIEQELRAVLDGDSARAGALRLAYQPCVALSNSHTLLPPLRGFEALLRWQHPALGDIPPGEFIGIAENCGLIEAVGDWVMRQAIKQLAEWRTLAGGLPYATWRVAVNVSPLQLARPAFAAEVIALLAEHDLPPHCLTIEVTEGVFSDERAAAVVAEMRQFGLKIAVDDFGIGYSSLSCLRRLPVDELKLDRCFLQRSDGGALHEDLLGALVQLARSVGLTVLAEGVETEEHLAAVAAAGCDAAQGWLFARALPPDEAAEWIASASPIAITEHARPKLPFSFRDIVEAANEAVVVTDADLEAPGPIIVYVNPAFIRMTGWKLGDVVGKSPRLLQGPKTDIKVLSAMTQALRDGRSAHARAVNYARSGMPYWCDIHASPLHDQHGRVTHFVAIERDVTHAVRRIDDLEALVERDPLTSIANRRGLERFAASVPTQASLPLCVAYIDIDRFKDVNDSFGHATGDALLLGLADLLCENMRRADFIGRLGGDEFLVCMPAILPSDARSVAERLHRSIAAHAFETPVGPLRINCSVGVAAMRPEDTGLAEVIARADAALYQAKLAGRGRVAMDGVAVAGVVQGEQVHPLPSC